MRCVARYTTLMATGVLVTVGLAGPAAAGPEAGECPAPFTAVTQPELAGVLAGLNPTDPPEQSEAHAAAAFAGVNKNADEFLCYIAIGKQGFVNVIDNVVPRPNSG
jgi:hypothetical protein